MSMQSSSKALNGLICYYSGSGNTRLACQYIQNHIRNAKFNLFNIMRDGKPDFAAYDIAGFATFTDFLDPPYLVQTFMEGLAVEDNKPAFVFNTYGFINGRTRQTLAKWASARGFKVIAGHTLHTPESYPPMIAGGHGNEQAPNEKELKAFKDFVAELDKSLVLLSEGKDVRVKKIRAGFIYNLLPSFSRTRSKNDMGLKYVDEALCDECAICEKLCPYGALKMDPKPVFDMGKCYGCWSCYNHCPRKAIYTNKFRGAGQYPKPISSLKDKIGA